MGFGDYVVDTAEAKATTLFLSEYGQQFVDMNDLFQKCFNEKNPSKNRCGDNLDSHAARTRIQVCMGRPSGNQ